MKDEQECRVLRCERAECTGVMIKKDFKKVQGKILRGCCCCCCCLRLLLLLLLLGRRLQSEAAHP